MLSQGIPAISYITQRKQYISWRVNFTVRATRKKHIGNEVSALHQLSLTVVSGPIWTDVVPHIKSTFFLLLSEWSLMDILRIIKVNNSIKMSPVPLSQGSCKPLYLARPVWNHTTQSGSKLPTARVFFGGGYKESENCLKPTLGVL